MLERINETMPFQHRKENTVASTAYNTAVVPEGRNAKKIEKIKDFLCLSNT